MESHVPKIYLSDVHRQRAYIYAQIDHHHHRNPVNPQVERYGALKPIYIYVLYILYIDLHCVQQNASRTFACQHVFQVCANSFYKLVFFWFGVCTFICKRFDEGRTTRHICKWLKRARTKRTTSESVALYALRRVRKANRCIPFLKNTQKTMVHDGVWHLARSEIMLTFANVCAHTSRTASHPPAW